MADVRETPMRIDTEDPWALTEQADGSKAKRGYWNATGSRPEGGRDETG